MCLYSPCVHVFHVCMCIVVVIDSIMVISLANMIIRLVYLWVLVITIIRECVIVIAMVYVFMIITTNNNNDNNWLCMRRYTYTERVYTYT